MVPRELLKRLLIINLLTFITVMIIALAFDFDMVEAMKDLFLIAWGNLIGVEHAGRYYKKFGI